jgi:hypothetical protein
MAKSITNPQITLKPQDLVVLLRLSLCQDAMPTYAQLAQLVFKDGDGKPGLVREALKQFVLYVARYVYPAVRGEMTRGVVTLYAAPPLKDIVVQPNHALSRLAQRDK